MAPSGRGSGAGVRQHRPRPVCRRAFISAGLTAGPTGPMPPARAAAALRGRGGGAGPADTRWSSAVVLGAATPGAGSRAPVGNCTEAPAGFACLFPCKVFGPSAPPEMLLLPCDGHASPQWSPSREGWDQPHPLLPRHCLHGRRDPCSCDCKPADISRALKKFGALFLTYQLSSLHPFLCLAQ